MNHISKFVHRVPRAYRQAFKRKVSGLKRCVHELVPGLAVRPLVTAAVELGRKDRA